MAYAEYGTPDGFVVVNAHGGLACRLDVAAADDVAAEAGVRLISPDRPGVGLLRSRSRPHDIELGIRCRGVARPDRGRAVRRDGLVDGRTVRGGGGARPTSPSDAGGDRRRGAAADRIRGVRPTARDGSILHPHVRACTVAGAAVVSDHGTCATTRPSAVRPSCRPRPGAGRRRRYPRRRIPHALRGCHAKRCASRPVPSRNTAHG